MHVPAINQERSTRYKKDSLRKEGVREHRSVQNETSLEPLELRPRKMDVILNTTTSANTHIIVISQQSRLHEACRTDCGTIHDEQGVRLCVIVQHRGRPRQLHLERVRLLADACARKSQGFDQLARALVPS